MKFANKTMLMKAFAVLLIQLALVSLLGAKLLMDRATRPRVWVKTAPVDPTLPIRGRYVQLQLQLGKTRVQPLTDKEKSEKYRSPILNFKNCRLEVVNGELVAVHDSNGPMMTSDRRLWNDEEKVITVLNERLAYFIPEHVEDPSLRAPGEELWVEVTVPKKGPPRPIQLGVKRGDGPITPLDLR